MLRRFSKSLFQAPARRRLDRRHPVASMESLEDRSLLSASCVASCAPSCAPTTCRSSGCAPIGCNSGAPCLSFEKLLCAIQKFEQTLFCQTSSCGQCGESCGGRCSGNSCGGGNSCDGGGGQCSTHPTCGSAPAVATTVSAH